MVYHFSSRVLELIRDVAGTHVFFSQGPKVHGMILQVGLRMTE